MDCKLPAKIRLATNQQEKEVIQATIQELREKHALDLDSTPSFERGVVLQAKAKKTIDYLVVGSSNAERLMNALSDLGYSVGLAKYPNWRVYKGSADLLMKQVKDALVDLDPGTVVFQALDNSTYYSKDWDGSSLPPQRVEDGSYHMKGELRVERREGQYENYLALKPLLDLVDKRRGLVVAPMLRYWIKPCCEDRGHVTNIQDQHYQENMSRSLKEASQNLKDFLFHDGKRHFKVVYPSVDLRSLSTDEVWGSDPIHPLAGVYGKIAEAVVKIAGTLSDSGEHKRGRSDSLETETRGGLTRGNVYRGHSRGGPSTAPGRAPTRGGQYRGWIGGQRGHYKRGNRGYNKPLPSSQKISSVQACSV
jgi:hypothetical protein